MIKPFNVNQKGKNHSYRYRWNYNLDFFSCTTHLEKSVIVINSGNSLYPCDVLKEIGYEVVVTAVLS